MACRKDDETELGPSEFILAKMKELELSTTQPVRLIMHMLRGRGMTFPLAHPSRVRSPSLSAMQ